ncbi:MAG: hypothetical protein M3076_17485 [Actinomycetota bacterium]|nr:hypothetical protein [Actinomycetota bacterium]
MGIGVAGFVDETVFHQILHTPVHRARRASGLGQDHVRRLLQCDRRSSRPASSRSRDHVLRRRPGRCGNRVRVLPPMVRAKRATATPPTAPPTTRRSVGSPAPRGSPEARPAGCSSLRGLLAEAIGPLGRCSVE